MKLVYAVGLSLVMAAVVNSEDRTPQQPGQQMAPATATARSTASSPATSQASRFGQAILSKLTPDLVGKEVVIRGRLGKNVRVPTDVTFWIDYATLTSGLRLAGVVGESLGVKTGDLVDIRGTLELVAEHRWVEGAGSTPAHWAFKVSEIAPTTGAEGETAIELGKAAVDREATTHPSTGDR
jgi:hypothetical protein